MHSLVRGVMRAYIRQRVYVSFCGISA